MNGPPSRGRRLASVIVNNHDYGQFVGEAIASALAQSHPASEVIVVDDGSTDCSRDVLARYADRATVVLQPCRGQAAACNAGFARSRGDVVMFLDADDLLDPDAVASAADALELGVARVQWPQRIVDDSGRAGGLFPRQPLASGDLRPTVLDDGPLSFPSAPMSGNAYPRDVLDLVLPIPPDEYRICADSYLHGTTALFGDIRTLRQPHGTRRVHDASYTQTSLDGRLEVALATWASDCRYLRRLLAARGAAPTGDWERNPFVASMRRMLTALRQIERCTSDGDAVAVVGGAPPRGCAAITGRRPVPFNGRVAPTVALDQCASDGATHIGVTWRALPWLRTSGADAAFARRATPLVANDDVVVFRLDQ